MSNIDQNALFTAITDFDSGNTEYHIDIDTGERIFEETIPLWAEHWIINLSDFDLKELSSKGYATNSMGKKVEALEPHKKLMKLELIKRDATKSDKGKTRAKD